MTRFEVAAAAVAALLLTVPLEAQWRSLATVDDATGERMVLGVNDGAYGQMRMLADCREGYYVLALGFVGDAVLADGSVVVQFNGRAAERHEWTPDADGEVAYVTTWPGNAGAARYDPLALAFFDDLRRYPGLGVWVTQSPATTVHEYFYLAGAGPALDALSCPHR